MATTTNERPFERPGFYGGVQRKTTKFEREPGEVDLAINASFERIGGIEKIKGMSKVGDAITETTTTSSSSTTTSTSTSTSTSSSSTSSSSTTTAA